MLTVALVAIALATTPDEKHFLNFVREYTQRGLGFLPGRASYTICIFCSGESLECTGKSRLDVGYWVDKMLVRKHMRAGIECLSIGQA